MKTIKLMLSYGCYPIWIYDENGELEKNEIADELAGDTHIVRALVQIQETYNKLFINNEFVFEYIGLSNTQEREDFIRLWNETVEMSQNKIGIAYRVENKMNVEIDI